jgi:hypothetical protein
MSPIYVPQSLIAPTTARSQVGTAYLQVLDPDVRKAILQYRASHAMGTEFVPAAFCSVGQSRLETAGQKVNCDSQTLQRDFSLFVGQILADEFGSGCVESLRNVDGSIALAPSTGWPGLAGWLPTCATYRVVEAPTERIIIDTVLAREGGLDFSALARSKGDHPVSLADGAVAELLYWMQESKSKRPAFPTWRARALELSAALDPILPIAPGGHERAALAGLRSFERGFSTEGLIGQSQAVWKYLLSLTTAADLALPPIFEVAGRAATFDVKLASVALKAAGNRWAAFAETIGQMIRTESGRGEAVTENDLKRLVRERLVSTGELTSVDQLELAIPAIARRAHDAAFRSYAPKLGESNAALDFDLLFALPLPAVVVTNDKKFVRFLRGLVCLDAAKVMLPDELLSWLATGERPLSSCVP